MSTSSKIEWTDATWNPVTGCSKVSQGCKNCYALREWPRLSGNKASVYYGRAFTDVRCHPERLDQPLRWKKPRRIFVNSMSDLFHEDVPDEFIDAVFAMMGHCSETWNRCRAADCDHDPCRDTSLSEHQPHTFQVLTKRPERMRQYMAAPDRRGRIVTAWQSHGWVGWDDPPVALVPWPFKNVWLGTSVEDQATADERIPHLLQTPAAVRFLSVEPLLGPVDLVRSDGIAMAQCVKTGATIERGIDWVISGGESGPNARPTHPDWIRLLRDQCAAAGVAFFFKQWGAMLPGEMHDGILRWQDGRTEYWGDHQDIKYAESAISYPGEADSKLTIAYRVGKKAAGRHLDGRTHDDYPA